MVTVRLYKQTGMNTANTVDNARRMEQAEYIDVPALDIMQIEHLSEIRVKATREQVKDVDYCRLQDTESGDKVYYAVSPFVRTSLDVATLSITVDSVLTAAGIVGNIKDVKYGDGIVTRHHVAKSDDTFGAYTEDDPLLVPSKELVYDQSSHFQSLTADENAHLVESTMSLLNMAASRDAVTYLDGTDGEKVAVPQTVPAMEFTKVFIGPDLFYETPASEYYDHKFSIAQLGISRVRSLGAEGCILNSWIVPSDCVEYTPDANTGLIIGISGTVTTEQTGIHFDSGANVQNKRLLYGNINMIVLVSPANGTKIEFMPEDLALNAGNQLAITRLCDPRPAGRPYFFPTHYKGQAIGRGNWAQVLPGMQWANAPLLYTGASGSTLTEINYRTQRHLANMGMANQQDAMEASRAIGMINAITGGAQFGLNTYNSFDPIHAPANADKYQYQHWEALTKHNAGQGLINYAGNFLGGMISNDINYRTGRNNLERQYNAQAASDLQALSLGTLRIPELAFPRSETTRDFVGNGVYVVKYRPQDSDLAKLDKILNMYGYKDTVAMDSSLLNNRSKYNYIAVNGLSVTDERLPLWLRESLAAQMGAGVRIWHQLPDPAAYTDGSNI